MSVTVICTIYYEDPIIAPAHTHIHTRTQELVNLLLTGVAVSNVFDGEVDMGSKRKEKVRE